MNVREWPSFRYKGVITRVVDADTVYISLDLGLRTYRTASLRIAGINAPELYRGTEDERERGALARDYVRQYEGRAVCVRTYKDAKSFDRYVGDLYLIEPDGTLANLADRIVAHGHAVRV